MVTTATPSLAQFFDGRSRLVAYSGGRLLVGRAQGGQCPMIVTPWHHSLARCFHSLKLPPLLGRHVHRSTLPGFMLHHLSGDELGAEFAGDQRGSDDDVPRPWPCSAYILRCAAANPRS